MPKNTTLQVARNPAAAAASDAANQMRLEGIYSTNVAAHLASASAAAAAMAAHLADASLSVPGIPGLALNMQAAATDAQNLSTALGAASAQESLRAARVTSASQSGDAMSRLMRGG